MIQSNSVSTPLEKGMKLRKGLPHEQLEDTPHYQAIIGSVNYVTMGTRPDLAHTSSLLSQYSSCPNMTHLKAAKHMLRYLNGTKEHELFFPSNGSFTLEGYSDADYATCLDTRRSFSGYIFKFGEAAISWRSRKQDCVTTSTVESEYVALSLASRQLKWLLGACSELRIEVKACLKGDNTGSISLVENNRVNDRSKHIDIHYHKIREEFQKGTFELFHVESKDNLADIFTKILPKPTHEKLYNRIRCAQ